MNEQVRTRLIENNTVEPSVSELFENRESQFVHDLEIPSYAINELASKKMPLMNIAPINAG